MAGQQRPPGHSEGDIASLNNKLMPLGVKSIVIEEKKSLPWVKKLTSLSICP
jgi:hypothetical protein